MSRPSSAPLYLEPDPRADPRWGPSSPRPLSRGAGRPGVAVRVSGQWLAGCGAAGFPPRSLSPHSLPREVARSHASCRTVGGAWVGGPSPPPRSLVSAVWAITCAAACVGAGAVAAAAAAGGGPESPTPWGRRVRRGHARRAGLAVGGACARASARPMRAPLRAAGPAASWKRGLGAEAWAGRVGSGGRPRRRRRHAGAGPVAAAGRRRQTGRWSAAALRAPIHGVGVHVGLVGGCAREGDGGAVSSATERHRAADRAEERPGVAKVGRGAWGARGVGGAAVGGGSRTPLGGDESRRASSTGANPGGGGGERHAVPSRPNRTGTGPAGGIPGGRAGLGSGALGPGSLVVVGRRGGDRAGLWAAAGEGERGRAGRAQGRTSRGPRGLGEGSRGRPFLEGGGGCSLPGLRRGASWCGAGAQP